MLSRQLARWAFLLYALALFTATHWPALEIPGEGRPDLWIHLAVFALWAALLIAAGLFGPPLSIRNILAVAVLGAAWAALDEALQGIPWVRRHPGVDDWLCNVAGIALACLSALALRPLLDRRERRDRGPDRA
ncbi:MAG: hypothetical protein WD749_01925 [Phycisphaerales bacterium]